MKFLNDLEYARPASTYAGEAVPEIKGLNESLSNEYQEARKNKDALDLWAENLDVRDVDFPVKKQTIDNLRGQFSNLVQQGDYQNANYLVKDVTKKFATDKTIQGALNSRAKEKAYQQDLTQRLDKGLINEDQYLYGMSLTKKGNQAPLQYDNETGLYKGMFRGHDVYDDKSKDIYDTMDKRISGWKEESIMDINGTPIKKTSSVPGGYINMTTGKEVQFPEVQNALMTELSSRGDYRDYLNQEKAIDKYKLTGGTGKLSKESLLNIMSEDELANRVAGTSDRELKALQASKNPKDKARLEHLMDLKKEASTKDLNPEELETIFNTKYGANQLSKYTSPASDKASFQLYEDKQWKNEPYLMSLDHKYKMAEKDLDQQKATIGISNQSVMENFSPEELQNNYNELKNANSQLEKLSTKYGGLRTDLMSAEDKNIYEKAKINKTLLEKNLNSIKEDMRSKGVDMNKIALKNAYLNNDKQGEAAVNSLVDAILNAPNVNNEVKKELKEFKEKPSKGMTDGELLFSILSKDKVAQKAMTAYSDKVIEMARREETPGTGGAAPGLKGYLQSVKMGLEEGEKTYFENKDLVRYGGQVLAIDEKDKNNVVGNEARQWNNLAKQGTEFKMSDGTGVADYLNKYNAENGLTGEKAFKLADVQVQPIYQKINGTYRFQLRLPNGDLKQVIPENQKDAQASLKRIAEQYVKSPDAATVNKGYEMLGQVYNDFSKVNLNEFKAGETIPVPIFNGRQENMYALTKTDEDSQGNPIFSLKNADGSDIKFSNGATLDNVIKSGLGNPNGNNFKSLNDLSTTLILTGFNGKLSE